MARMKFLCDADRCIECNACATACKNEHDVPWGINRRRVVTLNDGKPGERSVSMACMHCTDAPCAAVCPVNCFYNTAGEVDLEWAKEHHRAWVEEEQARAPEGPQLRKGAVPAE
jgi:formate dehydrogenase iron-sulfur subunit